MNERVCRRVIRLHFPSELSSSCHRSSSSSHDVPSHLDHVPSARDRNMYKTSWNPRICPCPRSWTQFVQRSAVPFRNRFQEHHVGIIRMTGFHLFMYDVLLLEDLFEGVYPSRKGYTHPVLFEYVQSVPSDLEVVYSLGQNLTVPGRLALYAYDFVADFFDIPRGICRKRRYCPTHLGLCSLCDISLLFYQIGIE